MSNVVGVKFRGKGKIYNFKNDIEEISINDYAIVETERGLQFGKIIEKDITKLDDNNELKNVIRKATKEDEDIFEQNIEDASNALLKAKEIASKLKLNMNIIESYYTFDRGQLLFMFVADSRVDFREMARELASIYKTRIELRQIGIRDKAKKISGIGVCGRELCCSKFLSNSIETVSISMAKNQNLALNPTKINGQCGRLLCCLNYEDECYSECRKLLPNIGSIVDTPKGKGIVVSLDILNKKYTVEIEDEGKVEITL